jgi:hypothetical protein
VWRCCFAFGDADGVAVWRWRCGGDGPVASVSVADRWGRCGNDDSDGLAAAAAMVAATAVRVAMAEGGDVEADGETATTYGDGDTSRRGDRLRW